MMTKVSLPVLSCFSAFAMCCLLSGVTTAQVEVEVAVPQPMLAPVAVEWTGETPQPETALLFSARKGKEVELEEAWQNAKTDKDREGVKAKAYEYLQEQFASDMERREKELESIEARLTKLRGQLAKRAEKTDEIIQLQLKQLTMSWDGLGWSQPQMRRGVSRFYGVPAPPAPPMTPPPGVVIEKALLDRAKAMVDRERAVIEAKEAAEAEAP